VADRIGAPQARTTLTAVGGNQVYDLMIDTASRIARGELDVAVVCAAETMRTRRRDHRDGHATSYLAEREGAGSDEQFGSDQPMSTANESSMHLDVPVNFYAMAETAIRHRRRETVDGHRTRIAAMWATASEIAAGNPDAWIRKARTADEIATESAGNRPVASPYPKLMTANLDVDQAGAVIVCSVAAAEAAGVPRERWILPWSGASAADHWYVSNRWAFDESPAMRLAGVRALELAGVGADDCAWVDLYSCFPAAVQVAQRELDIEPSRPFTITGGLTFAAGPLNCYCMLALVRAARLLRDAPGERAFVTGNGGYFTKHSMLVLSGEPSATGFRSSSVQADVDALPARPSPSDGAREATLETYTVTHDRDGRPERAIAAALDSAGARHFAHSTEADVLKALLTDDCCGMPVALDAPANTFAL
jgi:acetyl-CoA C-acetyltransferase